MIILWFFIVLMSIGFVICYISYLCNKKEEVMSFGKHFIKTEMPIAKLIHKDKEYYFLLDSGANTSILDSKAIEELEYLEANCTEDIHSINGTVDNAKAIHVKFSSKNFVFLEYFLVTDLTEAFQPLKEMCDINVIGILGNSFMYRHNLILDFKDLKVYADSICKQQEIQQ